MSSTVRRLVRARVSPRILRTVRHTRERLRRPAASPLNTWFEPGGRSGAVSIRPIARGDAHAWSRAMRANARRMQPWWGLGGENLDLHTDAVAFEHHLHAWQSRRRRGEGVCLGLIGPDGLMGEMQIWHLSPGGLTCEVGFWMSPEAPSVTRSASACVGFALDQIFTGLGIQRIDAPVAAANQLPRALLRLGGFEIDARIPRWRELHGELVDYDLFGLTPERWEAVRDHGWAVMGAWGPDEPRRAQASRRRGSGTT